MQAIPGVVRAAVGGVPEAVASMATWPAKRWAAAGAAGVAAALLTGVPTGIVHTSLYTRMTPVLWWNYPVWAVSAVLVGLTAATYVRLSTPVLGVPARPQRTAAATLLTTFAVGCPVCNKLVIALVGVNGALSYWAPLQPFLGALSVALLATGLVVRLRGGVACVMPTAG